MLLDKISLVLVRWNFFVKKVDTAGKISVYEYADSNLLLLVCFFITNKTAGGFSKWYILVFENTLKTII